MSAYINRVPAVWSFFPKDNPKQELRIRRLLMAGGSYLMMFALLFLAAWLGLLDNHVVLHIVVAGTLFSLIMYGSFRSGFNLRFRDPSLTALQICFALAMISYGMYYADTLRGVFLLAYIVNILFGVFRLGTRALLLISLYALASYGLVIALALRYKPGATSLTVEILQWAVLGAVLPWFALVGGYLNNLRREMRKRNEELKSALDTIQEMAVHDELTGAHNRWYLMERLKQEAGRARRTGSAFHVCIMDIDFFKKVNDTHGHVAGDKVLQRFVAIAGANLRAADTFARYGGEEFVLLMLETSGEGARAVAERTRRGIEEADFPDIGGQRVTASFGITRYQDGEDVLETLRRADGALYRAKSSGRNRVEVDDPGAGRPATAGGSAHQRRTQPVVAPAEPAPATPPRAA